MELALHETGFIELNKNESYDEIDGGGLISAVAGTVAGAIIGCHVGVVAACISGDPKDILAGTIAGASVGSLYGACSPLP